MGVEGNQSGRVSLFGIGHGLVATLRRRLGIGILEGYETASSLQVQDVVIPGSPEFNLSQRCPDPVDSIPTLCVASYFLVSWHHLLSRIQLLLDDVVWSTPAAIVHPIDIPVPVDIDEVGDIALPGPVEVENLLLFSGSMNPQVQTLDILDEVIVHE